MIWIVNGTSLKTDREKFASFGWSNPNYYQRLKLDWWDDLFPRKWRNRSVTVYFDTGEPEYLICVPQQGYVPNYYYVPRTLFTDEFSDVLNKFGDGFFINRPGAYFINLMEQKLQDALLESKMMELIMAPWLTKYADHIMLIWKKWDWIEMRSATFARSAVYNKCCSKQKNKTNILMMYENRYMAKLYFCTCRSLK